MRTVKCRLKSIIRESPDKDKLLDAIERTNEIVFVGSYFIRAYILHLFSQNLPLPTINLKFIKAAFSVLVKKERGPKKVNKLDLQQSMENFWTDVFSKVVPSKFDGKNLSYAIADAVVEMNTSYINNIQMNYGKYVRRFLKSYHRLPDDKEYTKEERKQHWSDVNKLLRALINGTGEYPTQFIDFAKHWKPIIVPKYTTNKGIAYALKTEPNKFMLPLLRMNSWLENNECRQFQPISLRTDTKTKYITFTTNFLLDNASIDYLKLEADNLTLNRKIIASNIRGYRDLIWNHFFHIDRKVFKRKGYVFNYRLSTDGFAVSISLISENDFSRSEIVKTNKHNGRMKRPTIKCKPKQDLFLSSKSIYIGDAVHDPHKRARLTTQLRDNKIVVMDPGKRDIGYFFNGQTYHRYSSSRRLSETKRLKYNTLIDNFKKRVHNNDGKTIKQMESELVDTGGKTMLLQPFLEYTGQKIAFARWCRSQLDYDIYLRKLNWFGYLNKQRHENAIVNELANKYGKDATFVIGDWSDRGSPIKKISVPCVGFKRRLARDFTVMDIDEWKTSQINHKTKQPNIGKMKMFFNGRNRKLHSILTYQMDNERLGCINRDRNAVHNMYDIVNSLLLTLTRPTVFCRSQSKSTNPKKKSASNTC
jgi:hypothetical protein